MPEGKSFNFSRRRFLEGGVLLSGGALLSDNAREKLADFLDPQAKEILDNETEYPNIENFEYPKIEEVPKLMQNYTRQFSSWREVAKDQRNRIVSFVSSDIYKNFTHDSFKKHFPEKENEEISLMETALVNDKLEEIIKTKLKYRRLTKRGLAGHYDPDKRKIKLDTLSWEKHQFKEEEGERYQREKADFFVVSHELWHAGQARLLMLVNTYKDILKCYINSGELTQEDSLLLIKDLNQAEENGRIKQHFLEQDYPSLFPVYCLKPEELMSYLMEIRVALHIVSETISVPGIP